MPEQYTICYPGTGFRNDTDGAPSTPVDKTALNNMESGILAANTYDAAAGTPSLRTLGTGSAQAAPGNDVRFQFPASGTLASRPAASAATWYFATDQNGGTLYHSDGASWTKIAPGLTEFSGSSGTFTGSANGQVPIYSSGGSDWVASLISNASIDPSAAIDPAKISGTAITQSTLPDSFPSRMDYIANGEDDTIRECVFSRSRMNGECTPVYGTPVFVGVPVLDTEVIHDAAILIDSTGCTGLTNWWMYLCDENFNKIAQTPAQGSSIPADETPQQIAWASDPAASSGDNMYYVAILQIGTGTPFNIRGCTLGSGAVTSAITSGQVQIGGVGATGQTGPGNLSTHNPTANIPYVACHTT